MILVDGWGRIGARSGAAAMTAILTQVRAVPVPR